MVFIKNKIIVVFLFLQRIFSLCEEYKNFFEKNHYLMRKDSNSSESNDLESLCNGKDSIGEVYNGNLYDFQLNVDKEYFDIRCK